MRKRPGWPTSARPSGGELRSQRGGSDSAAAPRLLHLPFGFPPSRPNPFSCRRRRLERARTLSKYRPRRHMSAEGDGFKIPRPKGWSRGGLQAITPIAHFRLSVGRGFIPAAGCCRYRQIVRRGQDPALQPSGTDKFPGYNVGISLPTFFVKKVGLVSVKGGMVS